MLWRLHEGMRHLPFRTVPAANGSRWLIDAARLLAANPLPFLLMGLVVGFAAMLPLAGPLVLGVFGPTLYAGMVFAAREQLDGRAARFEHLFLGFQSGRLPRLLPLCLPGLLAGVLLAVLMATLFGDLLAGLAAAAAGGAEPPPAELGSSALGFLLLAMVIGAGSYALVFFAVPRVMLSDSGPLEAMRDSLRACLANIGAFLLFLLGVLAAAMLLSLLLAWLPVGIGQLLALSLTIPWISIALLLAYRDVFGAAPGTPPASPVFEA